MTRFPTGEPLEEKADYVVFHKRECKLCRRVFPNFCKRHRPKMVVNRWELFRPDEIPSCIPPERHDGLLEPYNTGWNACRKEMVKNLQEVKKYLEKQKMDHRSIVWHIALNEVNKLLEEK